MKILITGSSGFLGRRAAAHFSSLGFEVLTPSHSQLDITDAPSVKSWFRLNRPDGVIHCAAISDTGACQADPEGSAIVNVQGSANLAAASAEIGAKFLFCSSDQVYAASSLPGPHKETEILKPVSAYARQKLQAEQFCRELCPDTVSLRLSWMYDSHSLPGEHGHLVATLLAALRDPKLPLTFPIHDHRGITDVQEVVRNLSLALSFPAGVYNFSAENDRSTYATLRKVLEELSLTEPLARLEPNVQAFSGCPRDIRMDTSLAASLGAAFGATADGLYHTLSEVLCRQ